MLKMFTIRRVSGFVFKIKCYSYNITKICSFLINKMIVLKTYCNSSEYGGIFLEFRALVSHENWNWVQLSPYNCARSPQVPAVGGKY